MFGQSSSALSALLFHLAKAQTPEEIAAYPDYADAFAHYNATWEAIKVKTEDGYTLTMFHITGSTLTGPYVPTKNAVLWQHGMGGYARGYIEPIPFERPPMPYQLAEQGFDVYLGNNSGVNYSMEHDVYSIYQKEFWQIDWRKYGSIDTPAQVEEIQKRNGGAKVALIGHSQGTTQHWAGMGLRPEWYDEHISIVAMLGSCTVPTSKYFEGLYDAEVVQWLEDNHVYVLGGPDWPVVKAKILYDGPQILIDKMHLYESLLNNPVQAIAAYGQAAYTKRFQEYTPDFWDYYAEHGTYPKTKLMDYGYVQQTEVAFYQGIWDDTCPLTEAQKQFESLGAQAVHWVIPPWQGHVPWLYAVSEWFRDDLTEVLQRNQ